MKFKIFAALVCGALMLASSLCLAANLAADKVSIGGIYPGMSATELTDTFGQPVYRDGDDWTYSTFKIDIERGVVEKVSTTSDTMATPDGVRVGLAAEVLNTSYGTADKVDRERDGDEYKYFSADGTKKIEFKVVNGIIAK
ncbi:MAG: hypothetical protein IJR52_00580, partial [Selenomonadaceae bacterium]|nr:hypothetical protein [Selenomonadaceae bacterium]